VEPEGSLPHSQVPATCPYPELFSNIEDDFKISVNFPFNGSWINKFRGITK
jgi:hypothetical protein